MKGDQFEVRATCKPELKLHDPIFSWFYKRSKWANKKAESLRAAVGTYYEKVEIFFLPAD